MMADGRNAIGVCSREVEHLGCAHESAECAPRSAL